MTKEKSVPMCLSHSEVELVVCENGSVVPIHFVVVEGEK